MPSASATPSYPTLTNRAKSEKTKTLLSLTPYHAHHVFLEFSSAARMRRPCWRYVPYGVQFENHNSNCFNVFFLSAAKPSGPRTVRVALVVVGGTSVVINRIFFTWVFSIIATKVPFGVGYSTPAVVAQSLRYQKDFLSQIFHTRRRSLNKVCSCFLKITRAPEPSASRPSPAVRKGASSRSRCRANGARGGTGRRR